LKGQTEARKRTPFQILMFVLYLVSFAVIIYYLLNGLSYYLTPYSERFHQQAFYKNLRPAGFRGHGFGVIGSAMMILMLLYSVRKRTKLFRNLLPLPYWLRSHIYLGIMGPLLVILHTSFKVNGLVAVSFWSMIAVALSGVLGRYLYLQIPRNISGTEIDLNELENLNRELSTELRENFAVSELALERIEKLLSSEIQNNYSMIRVLFSMLFADLFRPLRFLRLKYQLKRRYKIPTQTLNDMMALARRKALLNRRILLWSSVHELFHYWHIIHKPFAFIMYIIMSVHVLVAVLLGYTWIF